MPICTIPYDAANGAEIDVIVGKPTSSSSPEEVKTSKRKLRLLIDTGASKTAINLKHIGEMGLTAVSKRIMRTAFMDKEVNLYAVDLIFEMPQPPLIMSDLTVLEFHSNWRDGVLGKIARGSTHQAQPSRLLFVYDVRVLSPKRLSSAKRGEEA